MVGLSPSVRIMRIGVFEVDLHSAELRKRDIRLNLQSQPFLLLVTLLKRQGNLVTWEERCSTLWPECTSVDFDHSLGTNHGQRSNGRKRLRMTPPPYKCYQ